MQSVKLFYHTSYVDWNSNIHSFIGGLSLPNLFGSERAYISPTLLSQQIVEKCKRISLTKCLSSFLLFWQSLCNMSQFKESMYKNENSQKTQNHPIPHVNTTFRSYIFRSKGIVFYKPYRDE